MSIWTKFKQFADRLTGHGHRALNLREDELRLAAAALLIHAALVDGHKDAEESRKLKALLQKRFAIDGAELIATLGEAEDWEKQSVDLYGFTSVLTRELDQDGRKRIVEMLWEIVLADGVLHEFESNLVWRASELLGVSARDRVALRKAVESRL
ncbi:MAG: TerB family tellurite resistance protein [Alphaproteobacteria bacterium]|nr:TerB family tellurite resistance protein [Alphaproteobacteria bacterium]